jgi:thioredoxin reductase (NADPH)
VSVSPGYDAAFPTLTDADLALVQTYGTRRAISVGEYLFRQGDQRDDFYIVLSGAVDIIVHSDREDHVLVRHGPGRSW